MGIDPDVIPELQRIEGKADDAAAKATTATSLATDAATRRAAARSPVRTRPRRRCGSWDPIWDRDKGPLIVGVPTPGGNYPAGGNRPHTQRAEDVTVVIDGTTYSGPTNNSVVKIGNHWAG